MHYGLQQEERISALEDRNLKLKIKINELEFKLAHHEFIFSMIKKSPEMVLSILDMTDKKESQ